MDLAPFSTSQTTTVIGSGGAYSLTWPAGLAPGNYEVIAHLSDQPGVQSSVGSFTVQAVVVPPPPPPPPTTPQAVPALAPWATIGLGALLALLGRQRLRRRTG